MFPAAATDCMSFITDDFQRMGISSTSTQAETESAVCKATECLTAEVERLRNALAESKEATPQIKTETVAKDNKMDRCKGRRYPKLPLELEIAILERVIRDQETG